MTGDGPLLDRDSIRSLLQELGEEMVDYGTRAELFLVGGAAMALAYDDRRATRDLDAVFVPKADVYRAAHRIAERRGLDPDWLNDGVKGFLLARIVGGEQSSSILDALSWWRRPSTCRR